mmetsp:Transcript_61065/g.132625  ORF Transcript_61065/g.132625 Transcript_61065/m.132625 type:complete len:208 (-) Transcript_61065:130-753(-)
MVPTRSPASGGVGPSGGTTPSLTPSSNAPSLRVSPPALQLLLMRTGLGTASQSQMWSLLAFIPNSPTMLTSPLCMRRTPTSWPLSRPVSGRRCGTTVRLPSGWGTPLLHSSSMALVAWSVTTPSLSSRASHSARPSTTLMSGSLASLLRTGSPASPLPHSALRPTLCVARCRPHRSMSAALGGMLLRLTAALLPLCEQLVWSDSGVV